MNPDYFLFAIGLIWAAFASVQDIRTKEVANWLTFSLVFFGLLYRFSFWISGGSIWYFVYGLASFAMFFAISYAFYYSSVFAGGDAKLLMGLGAIIPGATLYGTIFNGILFIFALLVIGAVWSIVALFTPFVPVTWSRFSAAMNRRSKSYYWAVPVFVIVSIASFILLSISLAITFSILVALIVLGYPCLKAVEECMIIKVSASKLTEGDWILENIKVGRKTVLKTVHGLTLADIKLLKKAGKKVTIKTGVPFSPAFFFTILAMVFFGAYSEQIQRVFQSLLV